MDKIAVLFSGKGTNFAHIVKTLHGKECEVVVALTNNPHAEGIAIAQKYDIPLEIIDSKQYDKRESFDSEVVKTLHGYAPTLTVLAGFMRILTPVFTEQIKAINLHPSLLPRHKGLNAIEKSYKDDFTEGGISIHYVSSQLDGGAVVLQQSLSKTGLSFSEYDLKIRALEKETLSAAITLVLNKGK